MVNGIETNAKTQVFDSMLLPGSPTYPYTNNRVIGHSVNTYKSAIYSNPGIGQLLRDIEEQLSEQGTEPTEEELTEMFA